MVDDPAGRHDIGAYLDSASSLAADEAPSVIEQIDAASATRTTTSCR
jgi:hypothetical protein